MYPTLTCVCWKMLLCGLFWYGCFVATIPDPISHDRRPCQSTKQWFKLRKFWFIHTESSRRRSGQYDKNTAHEKKNIFIPPKLFFFFNKCSSRCWMWLFFLLGGGRALSELVQYECHHSSMFLIGRIRLVGCNHPPVYPRHILDTKQNKTKQTSLPCTLNIHFIKCTFQSTNTTNNESAVYKACAWFIWRWGAFAVHLKVRKNKGHHLDVM